MSIIMLWGANKPGCKGMAPSKRNNNYYLMFVNH